MRELNNIKIIVVDHGYGNTKTANTVTPRGTYEFRENSIVVSIPFTRVSTWGNSPVIPSVDAVAKGNMQIERIAHI